MAFFLVNGFFFKGFKSEGVKGVFDFGIEERARNLGEGVVQYNDGIANWIRHIYCLG